VTHFCTDESGVGDLADAGLTNPLADRVAEDVVVVTRERRLEMERLEASGKQTNDRRRTRAESNVA
jgi:hypothetical protein